MPSWPDLEKRFLDPQPALRFARLDGQTGTAGKFWHVAAASDVIAKTRFESLSTIAGRKIVQSFAAEALPGELRDAPNDRIRWYRALAANLRFNRPGPVGHLTDDDGGNAGWIATGSIQNPAAVSAAHCLELAAMTSEEDNSNVRTTINVSGQNARLNVSSVDNSINTASSASFAVFDDIRDTLAAQISGDAKLELLAKLDELKSSANTPTYLTRYKEFMQLAADHVTVLAPFLAALAGFL